MLTNRYYQDQAVATALSSNNGICVLPTGCHAKDTEILMFDGKVKLVQDVEIGEQVMGADGTPRNVLKLCRGRDSMFRITPIRGGNSFVVNKDHILALVCTNEGAKSKYPSGRDGSEKEFIKEFETER